MAVPAGRDEQALIARIREGDESAFGAVFDQYLDRLCRFAALYVHDMDVAEEIVADVFAALWELRETWTVRTSIETYLFSAVRNRAHNVTRGQHRAQRWGEHFLANDETPGMGEADVSPDVAAETLDVRQRVDTVLRSLPDKTRIVLSLRWLDQMGVDEIAAVLETTPAAVHMQLSRAMKVLRDKMPDTLR